MHVHDITTHGDHTVAGEGVVIRSGGGGDLLGYKSRLKQRIISCFCAKAPGWLWTTHECRGSEWVKNFKFQLKSFQISLISPILMDISSNCYACTLFSFSIKLCCFPIYTLLLGLTWYGLFLWPTMMNIRGCTIRGCRPVCPSCESSDHLVSFLAHFEIANQRGITFSL